MSERECSQNTRHGAVAKRVFIVSRVKRNPYVDLLAEGLAQAGPDLSIQVVDHFSLAWLWRHRREIDVLHLHWIELLFVYPTLTRSLKRWLSVILGLLVARLSGICVVYTVHNLSQHEGDRPALAGLANRAIFLLADAIHVHDEGTAELLASGWGRRRGVHIIPHGNYTTAYPNQCSRQAARERLGLGEGAFVYLFLGRIRPYKGLEELIGAFRGLMQEDVRLVIAGEVHDPGYEAALEPLCLGDSRIVLHLQYVQDEQVQFYLNACDICVLPYRHVTTSGAALLAFSFSAPIVAPHIGCFSELVGKNEERGFLYEPDHPKSLRKALRACRRADLAAKRAACARYIEALSWDRVAARHLAVYRDCKEISR